MESVENIIKGDLQIEKTLDIGGLTGKRVLSKTGYVVGRIYEIRINPQNMKIEGILVKSASGRLLYIGESYIDRVTNEAIILNIEVTVLLREKKVITGDGRIIGKVRKTMRKGDTNELESIIIGAFLKRDIEIPKSAIKTINKSIILNEGYNVKQKYFWQKPG